MPTDDPATRVRTQDIIASQGLKPGDDPLAHWHEVMGKEDKVAREKQMAEVQ
jgi:hypothetical protein